MSETYRSVQEYYGSILKTTNDLKTTACTTSSSESKTLTKEIKQALSLLSDEVHEKYYGCGICMPPAITNCNVLDLGCGAGRDIFCISKLIGESGHATGLDMTDEQLEVANRNIEFHTKKFGYAKSNVEFKKGYIEKLKEAGIQNNFYDVIVSNCVINLSPDKEAVLKGVYDALKDGSEFYFSDVYSDQRLSEEIKQNEVLWGECISGALYWRDLISISKKIGFREPRVISASYISLKNAELEALLGNAQFISVTYRLFKITKSQKSTSANITYKGQIDGCEDSFKLDNDWIFKKDVITSVNSSDVIDILNYSRYAKYFEIDEIVNDNSANEIKAYDENNLRNPFEIAVKDKSGGCCGPKTKVVTPTKSGCCSAGKKC